MTISRIPGPTLVRQNPEQRVGAFFQDENFTAADSPVTLNINAALGEDATTAVLICDGPGDISVQISDDGVKFNTIPLLIRSQETITISSINLKLAKLTHTGSDSGYRLLAI